MKSPEEFFSKHKYIVILVLLGFLMTLPSFLNLEGYPSGIDTPAHIFKIKTMKSMLSDHGRIFNWSSNWYCGYPFLAIYPVFSYGLVLILDIVLNNITLSYNLIRAFFFIALPVTSYYFLRKYSKDEMVSFIGSFLVLTSYSIYNNMYTIGRLASGVGITFYLLSLYLFLDNGIWESGLNAEKILLGFVLGLLIHIHAYLFYFTVISFLVFYLFKRDILNLRRLLKDLKLLLIPSLIALAISLPYFFNFINHFLILESYWIPQAPPSHNLDLLIHRHFGDTFPLYLGFLYILLFGAGVFSAYIKKNWIKLGILANFLVFFVLFFGEANPLYPLLPFSNQLDLARFQFMFTFWLALLGGFGARYLLDNLSSKKTTKLLLSFIIISLVLVDVYPMIQESRNWRPKYQEDKLPELNKDYRGISLGSRHWDDYLLPIELEIPNTMGWFQQADPHFNFSQVLEASGGLWYAHEDSFSYNHNFTLFKNLLRLSNTKYVFFATNWVPDYAHESTVGAYQTNHSWNLQLMNKIKKSDEFRALQQQNHLKIFKFLNNLSYCEAIEPVWISSNYYNKSLNFLLTEKVIPQIPVKGEKTEKNVSVDRENNICCQRKSPTQIEIKTNRPAWVLVKESHYPLWQREINQERKIYNSFGFMTIFVKDKEILKYKG